MDDRPCRLQRRKTTWVEQLIQNVQLCQFYKIKGISASFWGLSDFSGQVSQFFVNITPIELKSVTEW